MTKEKGPERSETIHMPEMARRASDFLAAIEGASRESPVSLDVLAGEESFEKAFETHLKRTDELYERHDELFFKDGIPDLNTYLDYEGILALSHDVVANVKARQDLFRTASLGLAVLQFAATGARVAYDPSLVLISSDQDIPGAIADKSGDLTRTVFRMTFADRIRGNILKIPAARLGYPGHLMDTHYAFWKHKVSANELTPRVYEEAQKVIPRFPAKAMRYDIHSSLGRPERHITRDVYVQKMQAFQETLKNGESEGAETEMNTHEAIPFVFEVLDAAVQAGYSSSECLRIAAKNGTVIGRLTERTSLGLPRYGKGMIRLEGPRENPTVVIDSPDSNYEAIFPDVAAKLQRRDEKGGICPARHLVRLTTDGETHENIKVFSKAFSGRIGVWPPVLREVDGRIYVDPAALTVSYVLFAVASNYYS